MGYFSNGTAGESYWDAYCSRCIHRDGPDGSEPLNIAICIAPRSVPQHDPALARPDQAKPQQKALATPH